MKLMIASDLHGSLDGCRRMKQRYGAEGAERLLLLGDLLYHGPRNDLPLEYDPKAVIQELNEIKGELLCVRGNCDAEVDQMVLEFPMMADYALLWLEGRMAFLTHGHVHNLENPPPLKPGDVLLHGHTHIPAMDWRPDRTGYFNPGSVSIPKGGSQPSYLIYEDGVFFLKNLEGELLQTLELLR